MTGHGHVKALGGIKMKIVLVSFNLCQTKSRGYWKTNDIQRAADIFIRMLKDDKTDFISVRKIKSGTK